MEEILKNYDEIKSNKHIFANIDKDFFFEFADYLIAENKQLEEANQELKKDIENMYDEEVVISIISDEFNLTRSEVLALLGESED